MMNELKFLEIYNDYLESGLSVKDFCSNQGMRPNKFFYWQNKLKDKLPPKQGFVPIILNRERRSSNSPISPHNQKQSPSNSSLLTTNETQSCEIIYPNGVSIKLSGCSDLQLIRSLVLLNPLDHV